MKNPWMKFYPADWRSDPKLRMCSVSARGLWMECLCIMHEATPYGHLLVEGQAPTTDQLAVLAGIPSAQLPDLLRELENVGVFSRTGKGVIYSRRMTRDEKKAKTSAKNGKKGGNPTLSKQKQNSPQDNPEDKAQKSDTRSHIEDITNVISPDGDSEWLFSEGADYLVSKRETRKAANSVIGLWLNEHPPPVVKEALQQAQVACAANPTAFVAKVLRSKGSANDARPVMDKKWADALEKFNQRFA